MSTRVRRSPWFRVEVPRDWVSDSYPALRPDWWLIARAWDGDTSQFLPDVARNETYRIRIGYNDAVRLLQ